MARLVGMTVVLLGLMNLIMWTLGQASTAEATPSADRTSSADSDPDDADRTSSADLDDEAGSAAEIPTILAFTDPRPRPAYFAPLGFERFAPGVYSVGPSPDPEVAAVDRDIRPRRNPFGLDERLNGDVFDGYAGSQQGEIEPGLYSTDFDATECTYELWHVERRSRTEKLIGTDSLASGRLLVTINGIEPDWFLSDHTCGDWYRWRPRPDPTGPLPDGDYWADDVAPGRWYLPDECLWELTGAFRGARLGDVVESAQGPGLFEFPGGPVGLRLRGCTNGASFIDPLPSEDDPEDDSEDDAEDEASSDDR